MAKPPQPADRSPACKVYPDTPLVEAVIWDQSVDDTPREHRLLHAAAEVAEVIASRDGQDAGIEAGLNVVTLWLLTLTPTGGCWCGGEDAEWDPSPPWMRGQT